MWHFGDLGGVRVAASLNPKPHGSGVVKDQLYSHTPSKTRSLRPFFPFLRSQFQIPNPDEPQARRATFLHIYVVPQVWHLGHLNRVSAGFAPKSPRAQRSGSRKPSRCWASSSRRSVRLVIHRLKAEDRSTICLRTHQKHLVILPIILPLEGRTFSIFLGGGGS